jgi:hypothetical protein
VIQRTQLLSDDAVVRIDEQGRYWLLNRRDRGWGEWGYWYRSLDEIHAAWAVEIGPLAEDEHGPYWPAPRARGGGR